VSVPDHLHQPRTDNTSSWRWIVAFYEYIRSLSPEYEERYAPLLNLCRHLSTTPHAERFRASQAQHDLVIAFKDRIALQKDDPVVLVYADCRTSDLYVERWQGGWPDGVVERRTVSRDELAGAVEEVLSQVGEFL
jgi:hypothetical protein